MKWCEQCEEEVGYVEIQVSEDRGVEYYELECEQCGAALGLVVAEVDHSG